MKLSTTLMETKNIERENPTSYIYKAPINNKQYKNQITEPIERTNKPTLCLRETRMLPYASCKYRISRTVAILLLTWKMRFPSSSVTLQSFIPRLSVFCIISRSTGCCVTNSCPITITGLSSVALAAISPGAGSGCCPVAMIMHSNKVV